MKFIHVNLISTAQRVAFAAFSVSQRWACNTIALQGLFSCVVFSIATCIAVVMKLSVVSIDASAGTTKTMISRIITTITTKIIRKNR